jgi:hypothetical protein
MSEVARLACTTHLTNVGHRLSAHGPRQMRMFKRRGVGQHRPRTRTGTRRSTASPLSVPEHSQDHMCPSGYDDR